MGEIFLRDYEEEIQRCMRCGFCRVQCPTWECIGWETGGPRGRMQLIKALLDGEVGVNTYGMDRIYSCSLCGYCAWRCPAGIRTTDAVKAARRYFVDAGCFPSEIDRVVGYLEKNKSVYERPKDERTLWVELMDLEDVVPIGIEADIVYFPGCVSSYSARAMRIAEATSLILDGLGADWTILGGDEWCCGHPFGASGKRASFQGFANHNVKSIQKLNAKVLLTSCAGCYRTFVTEYGQASNRPAFRVLHVAQFLEEMMKSGKLELVESVEAVATYHDPCELGRLSGIYEPPREVLRRIQGLEFRELPRNRFTSRCCGGGGLIKATNPDIASKMRTRKLDEAKQVGAEKIVSSCPSCFLSISEAIDERGLSIEMLDIAEIAASAMGLRK